MSPDQPIKLPNKALRMVQDEIESSDPCLYRSDSLEFQAAKELHALGLVDFDGTWFRKKKSEK